AQVTKNTIRGRRANCEQWLAANYLLACALEDSTDSPMNWRAKSLGAFSYLNDTLLRLNSFFHSRVKGLDLDFALLLHFLDVFFEVLYRFRSIFNFLPELVAITLGRLVCNGVGVRAGIGNQSDFVEFFHALE